MYRVAALTLEQIAGIDTNKVLDGYPPFTDRLRIDSQVLSEMATNLIIPDNGSWYVYAHQNRTGAPHELRHLVEPLEPESASTEHWRRLGLELDQKERPIHPYGRQLLASVGMVTGPGFYWKFGPNATTNLVVGRKRSPGEPEYAIIRRNDQRKRWALPGGFVETGETHTDAALREFEEELGLPVRGLGRTAMIGDIIIAPGTNTRDTLHAWTEDSAVMLHVSDEAYLLDSPLRPNPREVLDFAWLTMNELRERVSEGVFPSGHMRFVELSQSPVHLHTT